MLRFTATLVLHIVTVTGIRSVGPVNGGVGRSVAFSHGAIGVPTVLGPNLFLEALPILSPAVPRLDREQLERSGAPPAVTCSSPLAAIGHRRKRNYFLALHLPSPLA